MCGCGKTATVPMLPEARWQEAQDAERQYWYSTDKAQQAARRQEEFQRALWIAEVLDIDAERLAGKSVLDIGGGPQPIVAWEGIKLARRILVDPITLSGDDAEALLHVERVAQCAESYIGPKVDEAWGYNVLQHVRSPLRVLETAMRHARTIRWFEWLDQPTSVVHPHVVTAKTFDVLAGWRCVSWKQGVRDEGRGWAQAYGAGVWARA